MNTTDCCKKVDWPKIVLFIKKIYNLIIMKFGENGNFWAGKIA